MCFPAVFLLSEFLLAKKDLKPSRFILPRKGGKEGGKEAVYGDTIVTESESPSAQQTLFFPGVKTEQDVLQLKSTAFQFSGHFISAEFLDVFQFL